MVTETADHAPAESTCWPGRCAQPHRDTALKPQLKTHIDGIFATNCRKI
jgi:hypothetical protein